MTPTFCINLARRPDRWTRIEAHAAAAGLEVSRVEAVDAADPEAQVHRIAPGGPLGPVPRPALACTASHAAAWALVAESGAPWALILEDDSELAPDTGAVVGALAAADPALPLVKLEAGGTLPLGVLCGPALMACGGGRVLRRAHQLATDAAAYMISAAGARAALAGLAACDVPVDHYLFYPRRRRGSLGLPFGLIDPAPARQPRADASDIAPSRRKGTRRTKVSRGLYEAAQAPGMLRALAGGARVRKVEFR